ncbi:MAG: glycosyltransferase family 4 protein [Bacteriovoracaceae bacterium]|nr:glycosyltransferase family 4 protein [Bacteriovoracaceae bacterium]
MSKKVLYISPNGYLGGAERFVLNACIGHKSFGNYAPYILFLNNGELVDIVKDLGINHYVLVNQFRLKNPVALIKALIEARSFIKKLKPDVINSTMPYAHLFLALTMLKKTFVNIWFQHGPVGGILDKMASFFSSDRIYFNSTYLQTEHHKTSYLNRSLKEDLIVNYGIEFLEVDPTESLSLRQKYLNPSQEFLFLSAGRICSWKGYESTILALIQLFNERPELVAKVKYLIIGEAKRETDKAYEQKIHDLAQNLVSKGIIQFIPFQKNLGTFYHAADVFFHTSTIPEPFGLVVAEAMIQGTLVVGGSVGGVSDILMNGKTGYTFNAHEREAAGELRIIIEKKIINGSPEKKSEMAKNGQALIRTSYSIPSMIKILEEDYDS